MSPETFAVFVDMGATLLIVLGIGVIAACGLVLIWPKDIQP